MDPTPRPLRMYGAPSALGPLAWPTVEAQLASALIYWVGADQAGRPHTRPVWGIWRDGLLYITTGSPPLVRALQAGGPVSVHLDSATEVVVVDGYGAGATADAAVIADYDAKYDWRYDAEQYGPLHAIRPETVIAWTAAGPAGRDGFRTGGRWDFPG